MERRIQGAQPISRMCLVCGRENELGLHASFYELDGGELCGVFSPRQEHQGYPGRLHGGIVTAILDETIGRAVNLTDEASWGVTIELNVRFRKAVSLDSDVHAVGRITKDSSRIFEGSGEILAPDGSVAIEASGRFLKLPIEKIAEGDFDGEWIADDRPLPDTVDI